VRKVLWDKQKCKSTCSARTAWTWKSGNAVKSTGGKLSCKTYPGMEEMLVLTAVIADRRLGRGEMVCGEPKRLALFTLTDEKCASAKAVDKLEGKTYRTVTKACHAI